MQLTGVMELLVLLTLLGRILYYTRSPIVKTIFWYLIISIGGQIAFGLIWRAYFLIFECEPPLNWPNIIWGQLCVVYLIYYAAKIGNNFKYSSLIVEAVNFKGKAEAMLAEGREFLDHD